MLPHTEPGELKAVSIAKPDLRFPRGQYREGDGHVIPGRRQVRLGTGFFGCHFVARLDNHVSVGNEGQREPAAVPRWR